MTDDSDLTEHAVTRIFGTEELHRLAVETLPNNAPDGKRNAFVFATVDGGIKLGLHYRRDFTLGTFDLEAAYLHQWSGDNALGVNGVFWF